MTPRPSRRLFFALWPDELTRARLAQTGRDAGPMIGPPARLVSAANLHMTLAFLGDVDPSSLPCIAAAARRVRARSFGLRIDHWGRFPKPGILFLATRDVPVELAELVGSLWDALGDCGFSADKRPFRPHVTIARKVSLPVELPAPAGVWWQALDFALVESTPGGRGPVYSVLNRWPLMADHD